MADTWIQYPEMGLGEAARLRCRKLFLWFGMARSGHHALIDWVCAQFAGPSLHLNDCTPGVARHLGVRNARAMPDQAVPYDCIVANYESRDLRSFYMWGLEEKARGFIDCEELVYVVSLRDYYNNLASWAAFGFNCYLNAENWSVSADEVIGATHYLPENKLLINYNAWFGSDAYRRELSARVGGERYRADTGKLSMHSSFDKDAFEANPEAMKVLERYRRIDPRVYSINKYGIEHPYIERQNRWLFGDGFVDEVMGHLRLQSPRLTLESFEAATASPFALTPG